MFVRVLLVVLVWLLGLILLYHIAVYVEVNQFFFITNHAINNIKSQRLDKAAITHDAPIPTRRSHQAGRVYGKAYFKDECQHGKGHFSFS